jgi:hypothetical protein
MMSKPLKNMSDADRQPVAETTRYIIHCYELRKQRQGKPSISSKPQRVRITVQN